MNEQFMYYLTYFELLTLSIILILIIRNVLKYVIKLKRYQEFHIAGFYLLAFLIISLRIVERTLVLLMNKDHTKEESLL